jgi:hypothetical protein
LLVLGISTIACAIAGAILLLLGMASKERLNMMGLSAPMFLPGLLLLFLCVRNIPRILKLKREIMTEDARFDWTNLDFRTAWKAFFTRPNLSTKPSVKKTKKMQFPTSAKVSKRGFAIRSQAAKTPK